MPSSPESGALLLQRSGLPEDPCEMAQTVKNPPVMRETWVLSLDWEDPLEKGTATYSSILAWRVPWTEEPGRLQSMEFQSWTRVKQLSTHSTHN